MAERKTANLVAKVAFGLRPKVASRFATRYQVFV
jgi:hypothetical protein